MLGEFIPIIDVEKANKKLKAKNNEETIEVPENLMNIDIEYLYEDYQSTIDAKNRFEDKAKTIIAALTIAITLILNLSKIIEAIVIKFDERAVIIGVFILASLTIVYMLMAGMMSIQVLIKENILYTVSLEAKSRKDKKDIYKKTQMNINQNLARNNIIYSAYRAIRNSVFCLVVIFILAIFPLSNSGEGDLNNTSIQNDNIIFGAEAVRWIDENPNMSFDKIIKLYDEKGKDDSIKNIYDRENKIMVSVRKVENLYIIDSIASDIEEIR